MKTVATASLIILLLMASAWIFSFGAFLFGDIGSLVALPFVIYLGHTVIGVVLDMYYQEEA